MNSAMPGDLKNLVFNSVKLLGFAIQEIYGQDLYEKVEELRLKMKSVRGSSSSSVEEALESTYLDLEKSSTPDLHKIAKAFSLMLELINTCEAAYRTYRLNGLTISESKKPQALIFVFTSHPTEARSQNFLLLMNRIERLLTRNFIEGFDEVKDELYHLLRLSLRMNLANNRKPQVKDEAEEIFHIVLAPEILREQIQLKKKGANVFFRTWVGGDKDGHPKVGPTTLIESLNLSRSKFVSFIQDELKKYREELILISPTFAKSITPLLRELQSLKKIMASDGSRVTRFKKNFSKMIKQAEALKVDSPAVCDILDLMWLYPALVLPLEIREDSELIHQATKNSKLAIAQMLKTIQKIAKGFEAKWYVRGFVISMCQSSADVLAAVYLMKKMTNTFLIPVIPLFENHQGLTHAIQILEESFKKFSFVSTHHKLYGGRFEVMLGYSDSSKENGVLPARLLVEKALFSLEAYLEKEGLTPVFFHGSGGSISRGGGSIKEQIAWWPQSALNTFKVTTQGEMVQRNFNQPLIMRSQVSKIVDEFTNYKPRKTPSCSSLTKFTEGIQERYQLLVKSEAFQELVLKATPYEFLNLLKIGSRPTKRSGKGQFTIRAIPWILCWTQTRLLLPIWWGVGSSWAKLSNEEKSSLKNYYQESALMQSYIKNLGFTFGKMEMGVWDFHVNHSGLSDEEKNNWKKEITKELNASIKFFKEISGQKNFLWFRPWLGESILFRSSMIHPLNVIQKISLERKDNVLLRETVTGIASGMLTTG